MKWRYSLRWKLPSLCPGKEVLATADVEAGQPAYAVSRWHASFRRWRVYFSALSSLCLRRRSDVRNFVSGNSRQPSDTDRDNQQHVPRLSISRSLPAWSPEVISHTLSLTARLDADGYSQTSIISVLAMEGAQ